MQQTSFWQNLPENIIGLSPMDGLTDQPFRFIQKKYGKPAIMYTEFTSVEGVCHGALQLLKDFMYDETQRPIIAQIYGTTPSYFRQTALLLCELGFDGIDINMGCPAKNVAHSGAGAALIQTPKLAQEIIRETKAGIEDWQNGKTPADCPDIVPKIVDEVTRRHNLLPEEYQQKRHLPVSVKTRIGFSEPVVESWISNLLEMEPAAIALHGRTLKQQYGGLASWEHIGEAALFTKQTATKILGNGDVPTLAVAHEKIKTYGLDGVLIGRGSLGNPFVFQESIPEKPTVFEVAFEHCQFFADVYKDDEKYNFLPMRKHLGWYVSGIPHAAEIRTLLVRAQNAEEVKQIFQTYNLV